MINESQLKRIIKKTLQEMPMRSYTANPVISDQVLDDYDITPISAKNSINFNKRSPEDLMNMTHNPKFNYAKKLQSTFANLDINVDVCVQPVDNAVVNFFGELYREFGKNRPDADRVLVISPDYYEMFLEEMRPEFSNIFRTLHRQIENWINSHGDNDCLFVMLGDSIKSQKNAQNKVQWFTKTPWILTHTLFHQTSMLSDDFPEYRDAYISYEEKCNKIFPNLKRSVLYPYLTFTAGNKRNQLDVKITDTDLPNELLTSFLRVVKYLGVSDERDDLEIATRFFVPETPQAFIDKMVILVPYMKAVIDTMFDAWRGNIIFSLTENPDLPRLD